HTEYGASRSSAARSWCSWGGISLRRPTSSACPRRRSSWGTRRSASTRPFVAHSASRTGPNSGSNTSGRSAADRAAAGVRRRIGRENMSERRLTDVTLLARSPLLAGLPLTYIGTLLGVPDSDGLEQGASLATAGSPGDGLCFLLEGTAHAQDRSGRVVELAPGDHFGELTLLPEGRHDSNVTASTPLRVARLSPGSWATLTREHPDTALHLSLALLRRAAERLATAQIRAQLSPEPRRSVRSATITRAEGLCAEVLTGTRIADLVPEEVDGSLVVGARLDQLAVALHTPIVASASVEPLTTRSWEGRDIYRRTASIALLEAARRIGCSSLRLGP